MYAGYHEEGDNCPGCHKGVLDYPEVKNCSCHINPPCSACTDRELTCPKCGWEDDDSPKQRYVQVAPGLKMQEWKPRPFDKTKIDYRIKSHSSSSQICEGVYPEDKTRADVEKIVKGSFGGRFESFGNGKFKYIAYTD